MTVGGLFNILLFQPGLGQFSMFEQRLAAVFLSTRAQATSGTCLPEDLVIAASKQYRQVIGEYKADLLPVWHVVELLYFRALSSTGLSSNVNWIEFGMALSGYYKLYFYTDGASAIKQLIAGDWEALGISRTPGDLRSINAFMSEHNRWRQQVAMTNGNSLIQKIMNRVDYDSITKDLNWLEQVILTLFYYNERLIMNDWEAFYAYIDSIDGCTNDTVLELVKLILSGKLLTAMANLPDVFPSDALWFSCHLSDLLYYNTSTWLDPELVLEKALNVHFVELYADSLSKVDDFLLLSFEYYHSLPNATSQRKISNLLRKVNADNPIFKECLKVADSQFKEDVSLRMAMYQKVVNQQNDPKKALLIALESGISHLVDSICEKIILGSSPGSLVDIGIEAGVLDPTPYPLLQLTLDYNEYLELYHNGKHSEAALLLSNIIIFRRLPTIFIQRMLVDVLQSGVVERLGRDAMFKLLSELDKSKVEDKRAGRLALLRGISQNLL